MSRRFEEETLFRLRQIQEAQEMLSKVCLIFIGVKLPDNTVVFVPISLIGKVSFTRRATTPGEEQSKGYEFEFYLNTDFSVSYSIRCESSKIGAKIRVDGSEKIVFGCAFMATASQEDLVAWMEKPRV